MRSSKSPAVLALIAASSVLGWGLGVSVLAHAEEGSVSPYIDELKAKMEREGKPTSEPERTAENPDPYIQSIRKKMREPEAPARTAENPQPYIEQLKEKDPSLNEAPKGVGYTEEAQAKLPPKETGGAIEAVHEGRSDLHLKRPGIINSGFGIRLATGMNHSFSADPSVQANQFNDVYGTGWVPDLAFTAEYKPFYSETYGSLGFVGSAGVGIFKGTGRFSFQLTRPDGTLRSLDSQTKMTFLSVPLMVGAKYQFNLGHFVRPYALAGPTLVGMSEARNDGIGAKKALSKGITTTVGAAFLLDWISGEHTWNLYQDFGVKHFYLTLDYTKLTTISSPVDVSYSGLNAGFAFDL